MNVFGMLMGFGAQNNEQTPVRYVVVRSMGDVLQYWSGKRFVENRRGAMLFESENAAHVFKSRHPGAYVEAI